MLIAAAIAATTQRAGAAIAENGRVLATLDDWRAMGFLIVILFLVLVGIIWALLRMVRVDRTQIADERKAMWTLSEKFGSAAEKLAVEGQIQSSLNARVESALKRTEDRLDAIERLERSRTARRK